MRGKNRGYRAGDSGYWRHGLSERKGSGGTSEMYVWGERRGVLSRGLANVLVSTF